MSGGRAGVAKVLVLCGLLASTVSTGAVAAYATPAPGDVFSLKVDLDVDGTDDFTASLTVDEVMSTVANSTIGAFSFIKDARTFTFGATPATWFFGAASIAEDGLAALAASTGCISPDGAPCSMSLTFAPDYSGVYEQTIGDSDSGGPLSYARLTGDTPAPIPEPGSLLLLAAGLALGGLFIRGSAKA